MGFGDQRRLIVNADDFGRSASINTAVIRAHREGILTTASLMVNGAAWSEAVGLAQQNPALGVGLHLTLVCGRSTLAPSEIPGLVSSQGAFPDNAFGAGMRLFFRRSLRTSLEREVQAQLTKFRNTGLTLDHVNGHLNFHLHPRVLTVLLGESVNPQVRTIRLTRDLLWLNARLASGRWAYRLSHAWIFSALSRWARPQLQHRGVRFTERVFGLLQNGCVDEAYVLGLLERLPPGDSELYSHPCLDKFKSEFEALVSPKVRAAVERNRIQLQRYQDL